MHILYTILVLYPQYLAGLAQEEGDSCTTSTGKKAICTRLDNCPYATDLLRKSDRPKICSFDGIVPVVCCLEEGILIPFIRKPGTVSERKCREYYSYPVVEVLVPGGAPSLPKEFPHMAAVGFGEKNNIKWQCGGSLISTTFILTAAHCLNSRELGPAKWVRLGDLDFSSDSDPADPQQFGIKRRIPHPDYKPPSRYHDIALIELDKEVILTRYVALACLDTVRQHEEKQMTVTGWGKTEFAGDYSSFLLKADIDLVDYNQCQQSYKNIERDVLPNGIVNDIHICAGGKVGQDTCQGDSGGPLQVRNLEPQTPVNVYNIVGVTSFGKACGVSRSPGVYTRVYNYLIWIEDTVWS